MKKPVLLLAAFLCLVGTAGCPAEDTPGAVSEDAGVGGAGAAGLAGSAGTAGSAPAEGGVGGAAGAISPCSGLPGPAMAEVVASSNVRYCVDSTEVTQAQYDEFLKHVSWAAGTEDARCGANGSYAPDVHLIDPYEPKGCGLGCWTPDLTPNHPAVCIDWCDAVAYCKWAGKRLCGKIGGGEGALAAVNDPSTSQWHYACTNGGATVFPYGPTYVDGACNAFSPDLPDADVIGSAQDVGSFPQCKGTGSPYSSIFDMSGSVEEWTDECEWTKTPNGEYLRCASRGGDYLALPQQVACTSHAGSGTGMTDALIGFRCCKEAE
ncbi:MAG: SUMF1/EgtB/PvdO family nonheme iron enzyme [Deltaproteobacteria bacterium]|nr:SUMF1/EgtB/PvdO family nonheme iron enzyme [Deltaproteobacteria bacterium]